MINPLFLPAKRVWRAFGLVRNVSFDAWRLARQSVIFKSPKSKPERSGALIYNFHKIEKGLSLPNVRAGFGKNVIPEIIAEITRYEQDYGQDSLSASARDALREYLSDASPLPEIAGMIEDFLSESQPLTGGRGGTLARSNESLFPVVSDTAQTFLTSRHSLRNFTGEPVPAALVEQAVRLAQTAPSVCNRQSGRVFVTTDRDKMLKALSYQNGNRGFTETIGAVFIVTSDLTAFNIVGERNQPYVDGGIFAMTLLLGLHALGVGACMLNWSQKHNADLALRRAVGIPDNHVIITMIGAGIVPEGTFKVAGSPRIATDDTLTWL